MTDGSATTLKECLRSLHKFSNASGLKVSFGKSFLFPLGSFVSSHPNYFNTFPFPIPHDPVRSLGIYFTTIEEDFFKLNYLPKLSRLKGTLHSWSSRDLSPLGKIQVIKSLALSQLTYLFTVLPNPPQDFITDLNRILFEFVWSNKPDKVKRSTLINTKNNGGFDMVDISSFINSLKCSWIKRYLDNHKCNWKLFFDHFLKPYGKSFLFKCNFSKETVSQVKNTFYRQVCEAWATFNFRNVVNGGEEIVLNNDMLKINHRSFFHLGLMQQNLIYIKDFITDTGNSVSYNHFQERYNVPNFPFTTYFGLVLTIREHCHNFSVVENLSNSDANHLSLFRNYKITKIVYRHLIQNISMPPTSIEKWSSLAIYNDVDFDWDAIFLLPHKSVRNTKVSYFQLRFLHRFLGINYLLFKMKLVDSPLCTFCKDNDETLIHLFCECPFITQFWCDVFAFCTKSNYNLTLKDICFGHYDEINHPINFLILHAKKIIFDNKVNCIIPDAAVFYYKFHFELDIEYFILKKNGHLDRLTEMMTYFI